MDGETPSDPCVYTGASGEARVTDCQRGSCLGGTPTKRLSRMVRTTMGGSGVLGGLASIVFYSACTAPHCMTCTAPPHILHVHTYVYHIYAPQTYVMGTLPLPHRAQRPQGPGQGQRATGGDGGHGGHGGHPTTGPWGGACSAYTARSDYTTQLSFTPFDRRAIIAAFHSRLCVWRRAACSQGLQGTARLCRPATHGMRLGQMVNCLQDAP